jgi:hypothetical protein
LTHRDSFEGVIETLSFTIEKVDMDTFSERGLVFSGETPAIGLGYMFS